MKKREAKEQQKLKEKESKQEERDHKRKAVEGALTKELLKDISVEDKQDLSKMIANELKSAIETNYKKMNDLLLLCEDNSDEVVRLTLKNLSEVFCDVLPSYKIREEEDKE